MDRKRTLCLLALAFALVGFCASGCGGDDLAALPIDTTLNHLAVTPTGDLLVGGSGGALLRFDGQAWQREESGTTLDIHSISASAHGTYFGAGEGYTVGAQDGGLFEQSDDGSYKLVGTVTDHNSRTSTVRRIVTDDSGNVWAFGDKGAFFRFGPAGKEYVLPWGLEGLGIVATDAAVIGDRIYVSAWTTGLLAGEVKNGTVHEVFDYMTDPRWGGGGAELSIDRIAGVHADDVYVAGRDSKGGDTPFIGHFDGVSWSVVHTPAQDVSALHARAADEVYAAGAAGQLLRFDGASWTVVPTGIIENIVELASGATGPLYLLTSSAVFALDGQTVREVYRVGDPLR